MRTVTSTFLFLYLAYSSTDMGLFTRKLQVSELTFEQILAVWLIMNHMHSLLIVFGYKSSFASKLRSVLAIIVIGYGFIGNFTSSILDAFDINWNPLVFYQNAFPIIVIFTVNILISVNLSNYIFGNRITSFFVFLADVCFTVLAGMLMMVIYSQVLEFNYGKDKFWKQDSYLLFFK